jgi:integrase
VRRHLPQDLQVVTAIAYTFGWRSRSEVLPLQKRHLDLKAGTLRLDPGTTKNGEGRVVYLTPELRSLLAQQLERVDRLGREMGQIIPWLFPHLSGAHKGKRQSYFRKTWQAACKKAGVPGRIPHDFRRTAVRNMERAGVPRSVAMKLTGHKTESIYRRYAIVSDADLQEASLKLAATSTATSPHIRIDAGGTKVQNLSASGE